MSKQILLGLVLTAMCTLAGIPALAATLTVTSNLDVPDPPRLTLREAIAQAEAGDTIVFDQSLNGQTILLGVSHERLVVNKDVTITAASLSQGLTVDGNSTGGRHEGIFNFFAPAMNPHLVGLTLRRGSPVAGGAIQSYVGLTLDHCTITDNHVTGLGGAILKNLFGTLTLTHTVISNNTAFAGGAIYNYDFSPIVATDCQIAGNEATYHGGINSAGGPITLTNCQICDNRGGGVGQFGGGMTLTKCTIANNVKQIWDADYGGAIEVRVWEGQPCNITGCKFSNNRVEVKSGSEPYYASGLVINFESSTPVSAHVSRCTFTQNSGSPAVVVNYGIFGGDNPHPVNFDNCMFKQNSGGALFIDNKNIAVLNRCLIDNNNSAFSLGAGGITNKGTITVNDSTISNNRGGGGGIITGQSSRNFPTTCNINRSTISGNISSRGGGGILILNGTTEGTTVISMNNSTVSSNRASGNGGGIYLDGAAAETRLNCLACTITLNSADGSSGGGVYITPNPSSNFIVDNTIMAQNRDVKGLVPDVGGSVRSLGYNLVGAVDGSSGWTGNDLTGSVDEPLDARLSSLANHGGRTKTHALLDGSPALNAGNPGLKGTSDQRGTIRDAVPDIGSYER